VKDTHNENYKTLRKKFKRTVEDGQNLHVHGSAEPILGKWLYY
jgi:hypothetical protein